MRIVKQDDESKSEEIKTLRVAVKEKFHVETRLNQALSEVQELRSHSQEMTQSGEQVDTLRRQLAACQKAQEQAEALQLKYQKSYEDAYIALQKCIKERDDYSLMRDQQASKVREFERMLAA